MARPKATPEQREEIRRGIQNAAAELYRAKGLGGISARAVAKDAGVSVGTIYAHFGDLTGLMQSLWTGHVERQNQKFVEIASAHLDPVERLGALLSEYLRFGTENAALYRNAFMFVRPESHEEPKALPPHTVSFGDLLGGAVSEGQSSQQIRPGDVDELVQILWSGVHGCLALPVNMDRLSFKNSGVLSDPMVEALIKAVQV